VPKKFDFLLLDPPWPNRSVKRTHKTAPSTYSTAESLEDIYQLLMGMDLDVLMAESCLVAMWITNKPAVRDLVLGENGIFDCWGVELVEEWVWLKTTVHGEPVTPIDSVWRKPYEVLLLGRKSKQYAAPFEDAPRVHSLISRKVLMSVPDLHSRKPCLKELIEPYIVDRNSYRALEIFARHLVAGWWSWGDECIKFNGKQYW
jgi:N6-adenosine-specific RNA methylase IME4